MNKQLIDAALNASVVVLSDESGNTEQWNVFACWRDEDEDEVEVEINLTLAKPHIALFSGDLTAKLEDFTLQDLLVEYKSVIFYALDLENGYVYNGQSENS